MSNKELTSVLLSGLAVTGGVLATAATGGTAPIAGLIFTSALAALGGIGGNLLSSYLEKKFVNPTPKDEILRNGDLTRAVGKAIFILINDEANKADYEISWDIIKQVGKSEGEEWEIYLAERLQDWEKYVTENLDKETQIIDKNKAIYSKLKDLLPAQLTKYIKAKEGEIDNLQALTPETWAIIVKGVFQSQTYEPKGEDCLRMGERLHQDFPQALRKVLIDDFSQDGKAYASMQFRILSETLYYTTENVKISDEIKESINKIQNSISLIFERFDKVEEKSTISFWEIHTAFFFDVIKNQEMQIEIAREQLEENKTQTKDGKKTNEILQNISDTLALNIPRNQIQIGSLVPQEIDFEKVLLKKIKIFSNAIKPTIKLFLFLQAHKDGINFYLADSHYHIYMEKKPLE